MKFNTQLLPFCIATLSALTLAGCAGTADLRHPRADDFSQKNIKKVKDIAEKRAQTLSENETYFTDTLRCIGQNETFKNLALRISVSPIYDKTGKVFPTGSTAISDMTINALSYVDGLRIVETPLSGDISESRVNLLSEKYVYLSKGLKDNVVSIANKISHIPFGVLYPSQLHVAGALVQYDESTETLSPDINLDLDAFSFGRSVETISIGLQLRLINSGDGEVLTNRSLNKRGSILLRNKYYKIKVDGSYFRLINAKQYGIDSSVTVEDPKQYVIQEMVEKGVAELLTVFPMQHQCGG